MYVGIGSEKGKKVSDEDAFSYACERINNGTEREQDRKSTRLNSSHSRASRMPSSA